MNEPPRQVTPTPVGIRRALRAPGESRESDRAHQASFVNPQLDFAARSAAKVRLSSLGGSDLGSKADGLLGSARDGFPGREEVLQVRDGLNLRAAGLGDLTGQPSRGSQTSANRLQEKGYVGASPT